MYLVTYAESSLSLQDKANLMIAEDRFHKSMHSTQKKFTENLGVRDQQELVLLWE